MLKLHHIQTVILMWKNMTTTKFIFNHNPVKYTEVHKKYSFEDFHGQHMFKYADCNHVINKSKLVTREILRSCPLVGSYEYNLVDIKIHSLEEGECPCLFGWHLDGTCNPFNLEKYSIYHLFLIGEEQSRTLFINNPVELEVIGNSDQELEQNYRKQLDSMKLNYSHAPENTWITFSSHDFHSGPIITSSTNRILIRVCETNHVLPRNKEVKTSFKQKMS